MRQVAELAGVSVQTVSNHVNGRHQYMADDTRRRVAAAMRELGYHPNVTASGLRSSETRARSDSWCSTSTPGSSPTRSPT